MFKTTDSHEDTKATKRITKKVFYVVLPFVFFVTSWLNAQEGHPLTGTWTGDVGARHVTLALEWDGKTVTGTINPGPDAARITSVRIDAAMWSVHLEADGTTHGTTHIVIDGGVADVGSATRTLVGTWTEGGAKTQVTLTRVDSQSTSSNSGDLPANPIYDSSRRVTLRGTVTNVEWINPRVRFAVSVRDPKATTNWRVELPDSATALERNGWSARSLKIGDGVVVQAIAATGSGHDALANAVVLAKGGAQLFKLSVSTQSPYGPVPRWPDGQPRLGPLPGAKGYWKTDVPESDSVNLKAGEAAAMPWAKAVRDYRVRTGFKDDPIARCVPPGGPRQFLGPQGFQFVEQRELGRILVLLGDGDRNWRIIYTDGRPQGQPADVVSSYYGSSVGRWDKDTLVVDSVGYNEKFWFMSGGLPHTEALHLTERFTRTDLSTLKYEVTIDDPRTYAKPWKASWTMRWIANQEVQEFFCEEKTS
jgi:Family of unknown function (DUF6152)